VGIATEIKKMVLKLYRFNKIRID